MSAPHTCFVRRWPAEDARPFWGRAQEEHERCSPCKQVALRRAAALRRRRSVLFKMAHQLTRTMVRPGDCYRGSFGHCLAELHREQAVAA